MKPEPVGDRAQVGPERVGGAADVPAQRAGRHPAEDDAGLPHLAEDLVEAVHPPHREQVRDAAAADPDDVLLEQVRPHVGDRRHREQAQVADLHAGAGEGAVDPSEPDRVVAGSGAEVAEPGAIRLSGQLDHEVEHRRRASSRTGPDRGWRTAHAGGDDRGCGGGHATEPMRAALWTTGGGGGEPAYRSRHVRSRSGRRRRPARRPRLHPRGAARARRLRRGVAGGARGAVARRSPSRCWSTATPSGRPARRRCSASSTTRTWSGCIEVVHQPRRGGLPARGAGPGAARRAAAWPRCWPAADGCGRARW